MMTNSDGALAQGERAGEREGEEKEEEVSPGKSKLDEAFAKVERLIDSTEGRLKQTLARLECVEAELNEMHLAKQSACQIVAELEGDMKRRKRGFLMSGSRTPGRPSFVSPQSPTRVTALQQPKRSLETLQRTLSERGVQLGEEPTEAKLTALQVGRRGVLPKASAWMYAQRKLDFRFAALPFPSSSDSESECRIGIQYKY